MAAVTPAQWWVRPSLLILIAASVLGAWWRGQPAGKFTTDVVAAAVTSCTEAIPRAGRLLIVADGARAIDAWAFATAADMIEGVQTRCRGAGRRMRGRIAA